MAIAYLSAPASSVDAERSFSEGRLTVGHLQHNMSSNTFRSKISLGSWHGTPLVPPVEEMGWILARSSFVVVILFVYLYYLLHGLYVGNWRVHPRVVPERLHTRTRHQAIAQALVGTRPVHPVDHDPGRLVPVPKRRRPNGEHGPTTCRWSQM